MKILASSLACSSRTGSESLVGFKAVQALASQHDVTLVTSTGMTGPVHAKTHMLPVRFSDPNDVAPGELHRFERLQRDAVGRLLRENKFDVIHRVTPSGYKDSLLPMPAIPLILGPVLGVDPLPPSFADMFRPRLPRRYSLAALSSRIRNGMARRLFARNGTLQQLLERAAIILVGTHVTRRRLPERLQERCRLITYAGVEHDVFRPPAKPRPNRICRLLFAGRIVPYKGVELLLRSAAVAKQTCKFELTIVGGGYAPYVQLCKQLMMELNLSETVSFQDNVPREKLVELYQSADVFCMPSIETYGIAILEAMSSGCAALVSDFNGPGEIVQPGTGLKVPLVSPEQFIEEYAERIVQLVEDVNLRHVLGQRAREHVVRAHDWKQIQSRLNATYDETFSGRSQAKQENFTVISAV